MPNLMRVIHARKLFQALCLVAFCFGSFPSSPAPHLPAPILRMLSAGAERRRKASSRRWRAFRSRQSCSPQGYTRQLVIGNQVSRLPGLPSASGE